MSKKDYSIGTLQRSWKDGVAQTVTFIVTDDCNLRCKYCYVTHKAPDKRMNFSVAKRFIDMLLTSDITYSEAVILDFIGGEPLLEVNLIDKICDYFKIRAYELNHKWSWNYRINICTNGVNYLSEEVQKFIDKNYGKISMSITIDGTKEKHDLQRVFPDGSGSYDIIEKGINTWLDKFPGSTKVTFASDDLPMLKDSIISLWNNGITQISSNVVFENVWKDGDDKILENQLKSLADYIIDNNLYNKGYTCSFFSDSIGFPYTDEDYDKTYCGAGKMIALSSDGRVFPCLRYYGHSLNKHPEWPVGSIDDGLDMERIRPFMLATHRVQSDEECLNCEIASGCAFCQGFNYDEADTPTNFFRAKYICKMHKARVRANEYYFAKLLNRFDIRREDEWKRKKELYFLMSDDYVNYCLYNNSHKATVSVMSEDSILKGLEYAAHNFFRPVFVHDKEGQTIRSLPEYEAYDILHIVPYNYYGKAVDLNFKNIIPVIDSTNYAFVNTHLSNVILNISANDLENMSKTVIALMRYADRININVLDLDKTFNENVYMDQLNNIKDEIFKIYEDTSIVKEIDILTDILFIKHHDNCGAGDRKFVVGPNDELYTCCGCYSDNQISVGNTDVGIVKKYDARLYKTEYNNLCVCCDAYQCKNCVHINLKSTNEVNVSPSFQCRKSNIERNISSQILEFFKDHNFMSDVLEDKELPYHDYLDPMKVFMDKTDGKIGYYKFNK